MIPYNLNIFSGKCFLLKVMIWVQLLKMAHSRILSSDGSSNTGLKIKGPHTIFAKEEIASKIFSQSFVEILKKPSSIFAMDHPFIFKDEKR